MSANYKNWVPNGMVMGFAVGTAALAFGASAAVLCGKKLGKAQMPIAGLLAAGSAMTALSTLWLKICQDRYSYDGSRQLSRQIIEGTAEYVDVPDGGIALDVGCGSGALTIACAIIEQRDVLKYYRKQREQLLRRNTAYVLPAYGYPAAVYVA